MTSRLTSLLFTALSVTGAAAQTPWTAQLGIQGGYSHVKPSGTGPGDQAHLLGFPGFGLPPLTPTFGALFAIVPLTDRVAFEPSITAAQLSFGLGVSTFTAGLRLNYALGSHVYAAAGANIGYAALLGGQETQLGIQVGAGYRLRLSPLLNGRIEINWITTGDTDNLEPNNVYSVALGVSSQLTGRPRTSRRGSSGRWESAFGIAGGYAGIHIVDQGDVASLGFPGFGAGLQTNGLPVPTPPTVFMILPIARNLAIEPGFDLHRLHDIGGDQLRYSANYAARLNYALGPGWYVATGGNIWHLHDSGEDPVVTVGASVAGGYRFHLTGTLGGRVELNYTMFPRNDDLDQASNTLALLVGVMMPLR